MAQATAVKLGIKPNDSVLVMGLPVAGAVALLGDLPDAVSVVDDTSAGDGAAGLVIFFAHEVADVSRSARSASERTTPAGRFWIAYRKGAKKRRVGHGEAEPLHRDTLQAALAALGLNGVTLIALDDTWSAMRVMQVTAPASVD